MPGKGKNGVNSQKSSTSKGATPSTDTAHNEQETNSNVALIEMIKLLILQSETNTEKRVNIGEVNCDKLISVLREKLESNQMHNENEIYNLKDSFDKLKSENKALEKRVENAEARVKFLEEQQTSTNYDIDDIEQMRRSSYLVVNNLPHEHGTTDEQLFLNMCESKIDVGPENLTLIKSKISNVNRFQVSRNDRISNNANITGKPRPLVVRFTDPKYRDIVYKKKKALKHSGIVITEYLTKKRSALLKLCFDKIPGSNTDRSIWTDNGRILVKLTGKDIEHIKDTYDLNKFLQHHFPGTATGTIL